MNKKTEKKLKPRKAFRKCGACSHAMFRLTDQEFDNISPCEERASDILAGGLVQKGHQCGMLWGASMAVGKEAFRVYKDPNIATAKAISVSGKLTASFKSETGTVNCRDITNVDWESKLEMFWYMLKTIARGFVFTPCFNLIVKWSPEAIKEIDRELPAEIEFDGECVSCTSETLKKMGASEEDAVTVSGLAGGIGLTGEACGALGAAIWYQMLENEKQNPGEPRSMFGNPEARIILNSFLEYSNREYLCKKITGKEFRTIDEHTEYIKSGGCKELIDTLAAAYSED